MSFSPPREINVVRKEEKEAKLREFIVRDLEARRDCVAMEVPAPYLMIARSLESPVARALLSVSTRVAEAGIPLKFLFLMEDSVARDLDSFGEELLARIDARLVADTRILDAHEFLVLSPTTVWVGDCMRRDPAKRDAYEFYSLDAPDSSRSAARSFDRLWRIASPLLLRRLPGTLPDAAVITAETAPKSTAGSVEAATRH
jgi:hypothetical protein